MTLRQLIDNYDNDQGDVYRCYPKDDPILPWNVAGMNEEEWYDPDRSFARLEKYLIPYEAFKVKWRDVQKGRKIISLLEGLKDGRFFISEYPLGLHGK